jgi:hypothetical protein
MSDTFAALMLVALSAGCGILGTLEVQGWLRTNRLARDMRYPREARRRNADSGSVRRMGGAVTREARQSPKPSLDYPSLTVIGVLGKVLGDFASRTVATREPSRQSSLPSRPCGRVSTIARGAATTAVLILFLFILPALFGGLQ